MNPFAPINGVLLVVHLAILVVIGFGFIDALRHPDSAFRGAGKLYKNAWLAILGVAFVLSLFGFASIIGLIAGMVYLIDVRPALRAIRGSGGSRGSSSSGPYGPW
jgi:hypothetical protein